MKHPYQVKRKPIRYKSKARFRLKIALWIGAITVLTVVAAALFDKYYNPEISRGVITRMWVVPAHEDRRVKDPVLGIWERAWLDTMWMMEIQDVTTKKLRAVEVHRSMFDIYMVGAFIGLGDSLEFAQYAEKTIRVKQERAEADNKKKYKAKDLQ